MQMWGNNEERIELQDCPVQQKVLGKGEAERMAGAALTLKGNGVQSMRRGRREPADF